MSASLLTSSIVRDCSEMPSSAPHTAWMPSQKRARESGLALRADILVLRDPVNVEGQFRCAVADRASRIGEDARCLRLEIGDAQPADEKAKQRQRAYEPCHAPWLLSRLEETRCHVCDRSRRARGNGKDAAVEDAFAAERNAGGRRSGKSRLVRSDLAQGDGDRPRFETADEITDRSRRYVRQVAGGIEQRLAVFGPRA